MIEKETKPAPKPEETRELNFEVCKTHGIRYPRGAECPKCKAEG